MAREPGDEAGGLGESCNHNDNHSTINDNDNNINNKI